MNKLFDWDECIERNQKFPNSFRSLLIGESSSGKTCLLLRFLLEDGWLDYDNLILIGNSLYQLKYQIIKKAFDCGLEKREVCELFKMKEAIIGSGVDVNKFIETYAQKERKRDQISVHFYESDDVIPDPSSLDISQKNLVVFDDTVSNRNQETQKAYFTRGRHSNTSVFYLSQSYFALDRKSIRLNSNLLILFRLDERDVQSLWHDRISRDMSIHSFKEYCMEAWSQPYGFVYIDFSKSFQSGMRYR